MSSKKISWYEAKQIGEAVARTAFEHLLKPHEDKLTALAMTAHKRICELGGMSATNIHILKEAGVLDLSDDCMVVFENDDERWLRHTLKSDRQDAFVTGRLNVQDKDLVDAAKVVWAPYCEVVKKKDELAETVQQQINGKTVTSVLKTWPEIAQFVRKIYPDNGPNPMTVPFDALLARFLPALPAPTAT